MKTEMTPAEKNAKIAKLLGWKAPSSETIYWTSPKGIVRDLSDFYAPENRYLLEELAEKKLSQPINITFLNEMWTVGSHKDSTLSNPLGLVFDQIFEQSPDFSSALIDAILEIA